MYLGQTTGEVKMAGKYTLKGFHSVEIKKSVHQIAQSAKLTLPTSAVIRNHQITERIKIADFIKEGDSISIAFGYNGANSVEFTGYIKSINYATPLEIECEDEMYLFRNTPIKASFDNLDIRNVLAKIAGEVSAKWALPYSFFDNMPQIKVQNFIANNQSAIWALQQLKDWYPMLGIYLTYINGEKTLYCGLLYQDLGKDRPKYGLSGAINNTVSAKELKYQTVAKTVKVIWKLRKPDGTMIVREIGDANAELVIKKSEPIPYDIPEALLQQMSEQEKVQKNYVGYNGKFTTFLTPACDFGSIANLNDPQFPDRSGNYFIGTVTTKFGTQTGGRRELEIDFRLR